MLGFYEKLRKVEGAIKLINKHHSDNIAALAEFYNPDELRALRSEITSSDEGDIRCTLAYYRSLGLWTQINGVWYRK